MTEKQFEGQVLAWAYSNGIWLNVYDSKAKPTLRGHYQAQGIPVGTPDLLGIDRQGKFVAIELKRPGPPAIPSLEQYRFLLRVIESNGFAVCSNQLSLISSLYQSWVKSPCQKHLKAHLPSKVYHGKPRRILDLSRNESLLGT